MRNQEFAGPVGKLRISPVLRDRLRAAVLAVFRRSPFAWLSDMEVMVAVQDDPDFPQVHRAMTARERTGEVRRALRDLVAGGAVEHRRETRYGGNRERRAYKLREPS